MFSVEGRIDMALYLSDYVLISSKGLYRVTSILNSLNLELC